MLYAGATDAVAMIVVEIKPERSALQALVDLLFLRRVCRTSA